MRIDQRLNLVIPIEREDGMTDYVHSAPISREVFEKYFIILGKTFASIYNEGFGETAGPRVASLLMKHIANTLDGDNSEFYKKQVDGLLNEVRRLSNVVTPGKTGTIPLQQALDQRLINGDDAAEVENALVFFTAASSLHRRKVQAVLLEQVANLWGAQTTLLNCTEYLASLPKLTDSGNTGAMAAA